MRFQATILLSGKTATGIRVPPEVVEGLGPSRRPAVRVTTAIPTAARWPPCARGGLRLTIHTPHGARAR